MYNNFSWRSERFKKTVQLAMLLASIMKHYRTDLN